MEYVGNKMAKWYKCRGVRSIPVIGPLAAVSVSPVMHLQYCGQVMITENTEPWELGRYDRIKPAEQIPLYHDDCDIAACVLVQPRSLI